MLLCMASGFLGVQLFTCKSEHIQLAYELQTPWAYTFTAGQGRYLLMDAACWYSHMGEVSAGKYMCDADTC